MPYLFTPFTGQFQSQKASFY